MPWWTRACFSGKYLSNYYSGIKKYCYIQQYNSDFRQLAYPMKEAEIIQQELFRYVKENTFKDTSGLSAETLLFVEGIFDSMGFVLLIDFLEEKFNVEAADDELVEENFESINAITNFVLGKNVSITE
jgi:acyl carrier protein